MLPDDLRERLEAALGAPISGVAPRGGGFGASLLRLSAGGAGYALKWAPGGPPASMVAAEARGLRALAATGAIRVPAMIATGDSPAFLLTEWIDGAGARPDMAALGEHLAALHRHSAPAFGLEADNYIGGTPQANGWQPTWPAFFRARRLQPQIAWAEAAGLLSTARRRTLERLVARLDDLLGVPAPPSLIHGDLWGGNVVAGPGGAPALIDPAVSYSHREADLAFTELFGGFTARFYAAYADAWPLDPGYAARRPIYNLYHALNHANLFGSGYLPMVDDLLGQIRL
ncbi:MAG: fructosamine kinase family protein [Chloroflexales bacterium]|nr:fructosamine kinase family protein [Chloroflexales bacterium]